jgi:hypothetical protein
MAIIEICCQGRRLEYVASREIALASIRLTYSQCAVTVTLENFDKVYVIGTDQLDAPVKEEFTLRAHTVHTSPTHL